MTTEPKRKGFIMRRITPSFRNSPCRPVFSYFVAAVLLLAGNLNTALADYRDPLDLHAMPMDSAPQSLLLDITRAGERLVAVGERGHILFSDDMGKNWAQAEVPVRTQLNGVFFVDEKLGWAVGEDAVILHSADGGASWQKQFDARDAEMQGPLLDLYFENAREGYAVGVFNKLYRTVDGGQHWEEWQDHADNLDEWHLFAMATNGENTLYITSEAGLLFRSLDGGESFEPLQTDHDGSFHGVLAKRGYDGRDRLILSGVGGKLFTSNNGGESWLELDSFTEAGLSGGTWLADGSALVVGADGVILHISADLTSAKKFQRENGLPLSSVIQQARGDLVLVGLGGIQSMQALQSQ